MLLNACLFDSHSTAHFHTGRNEHLSEISTTLTHSTAVSSIC